MRGSVKRKRAAGGEFDIVTVGAATVDTFARSKAFEYERDAKAPEGFDAVFPMGSKIPLDELAVKTGGGATNAAVTFRHAGLKTATVCRIGKDVFGDLILSELGGHGIAADFIQIDPEHGTAQSVVLLAGSGSRSILTYRGASAHLDKRAIPWSKIRTRWFYVTSFGGDLGLFTLLLDCAERIGASVAWNPGVHELAKGIEKIAPLIRRIDILDLNREEAAELANEAPRHLRRIIEKIGNLPKMGLLLSDGPKGAYLHTRCCTWYAPPLPAKPLNTTGAGDALGSGFVAGFVKTCDLSIGLKFGMLNATNVITHMGAKTGLLPEWPSEREFKRVVIRPARLHE
jgi:sugar/nucleoside kinase (ribokinase family)